MVWGLVDGPLRGSSLGGALSGGSDGEGTLSRSLLSTRRVLVHDLCEEVWLCGLVACGLVDGPP